MTDDEAIDEAIRRTGVGRYRHLCSDANAMPPPNDPATWRRFVREVASGGPTPVGMAAKSGDPPLATRGAHLARELWAWAVSGFRLAGEPGRRLAICEACEHFDAAPRQCRLCTCYMDLKVHLQTAQCPVDKW